MDLRVLAPIIEAGLLWCYLPFIILFYKNRHVHPLKGRQPNLVVALNVAILVIGVNFMMRFAFWDYYPCVVWFWLFGPTVIGSLYIFVYRLTCLVFTFEITEDLCKLEESKKNNENWNPGWFTRHRYLSSGNFWIGIGIVSCIIYIIAMSILTATFSELQTTQPVCEQTTVFAGYIVNVVLACAYMSTAVLLAVKMSRHADDAFHIKMEHKLCVLAAGPATTIAAICSLVLKDLFLFELIFICSLLIPSHVCFCLSTVWPYYLSYKELKVIKKQQEEEKKLSLLTCLENPEGCSLFRDYLQTELSIENLQFYLEVCDYEKKNPELYDEINHHANKIFDFYISDVSHFQVNIPGTMRTEITEKFQDNSQITDLTIFTRAKLEIYYLMEQDSFSRFQRTPQFLKFVSQFKPAQSRGPSKATNSEGSLGKESKSSSVNEPLKRNSQSSAAVIRESEIATPTIELRSLRGGSPSKDSEMNEV